MVGREQQRGRYAGFPLSDYEQTYQKLFEAGERGVHRELLELMAEQTREKFQRAFEAEDGGKEGLKPDIVADLQSLVGKILQSLEQQDLR